MSGRRAGSGPEAAPILTFGALLLAVGLLFLLAGDTMLPSDPTARGLWTALVGTFVLLGGVVYLLWPSARPTPSTTSRAVAGAGRRPRRPVPTPRIPVADPSDPIAEPSEPSEPTYSLPPAPHVPARSAGPAVLRAAALAAEASEPSASGGRSSGPTSIPGAYLLALGGQGSGPELWNDIAPPIAAALPFSPGMRRSLDGYAPWEETADASEHESPQVELELARLRARVRELEVPVRSASSTAVAQRLLGIPGPAKEPPAPPTSPSVGSRGCVGCGTGLAASGPQTLCWGCGRTLCTTCYWRYGPGPGLHRCPDCLARAPAGSAAISGGRLNLSADASNGPAVPVPRSTQR